MPLGLTTLGGLFCGVITTSFCLAKTSRFATYSRAVFPALIPEMAASQSAGWLFFAMTTPFYLVRARPWYLKEWDFGDDPVRPLGSDLLRGNFTVRMGC